MDFKDDDGWAGPPRRGLHQVVPARGDCPMERVARGLRGELGRTLLEPLPPGWEHLLRQLGEAERRSESWRGRGPRA